MLKNFQLAAIVKQGDQWRVLRIPIHQTLQKTLAAAWLSQYDAFCMGTQEIKFNAGYQPSSHECFVLKGFDAPEWIAKETSLTIGNLDAINDNETLVTSVKGLIAFARGKDDKELVLFQNFSRSHIIRPGHSLFFRDNNYETTQRPGLTLEDRLSAVFLSTENKLIFRNFRSVNTFLPLMDHYEEASEHQIREVLAHKHLAPANVDALATDSNQWFRKRFAMLRDSGILDKYSTKEIQSRSKGCDVEIHITDGKIVFPEERSAAKKLLQFLNEEIFRGPITDTLFETNSKREAD